MHVREYTIKHSSQGETLVKCVKASSKHVQDMRSQGGNFWYNTTAEF